VIVLISWCHIAYAHGGVVLEDDLCVINIGFYKAHFTIYQPGTRANEEFCEDIPDATETVFVLDYLHDSLKEVPVDFRIIRDVQDLGVFAKWEDIERLDDIEAATVFYQSPVQNPNAQLAVEYVFEHEGGYIGIVTAGHPTLDKTYQAVFAFRVGGADLGYWPVLIAVMILVPTLYWLSNGGYARFRTKAHAA